MKADRAVAMEGGKPKKKSSAITLDQFVSIMSPLIDIEKVFSLFLHRFCSIFFWFNQIRVAL